MKKFLGILILSLLLSENSYAEKILLACQIVDKGERPYFLSLDLKNKILSFEGLYKITVINDKGLRAERITDISDTSYFAEIVIDRERGNMIFQNSKKSSKESQWVPFEKKKYSCNRSPVF